LQATNPSHKWLGYFQDGSPQGGRAPSTQPPLQKKRLDWTNGALFIHQRCKHLGETLPALQHDPNRPEDALKVDVDEEDVGVD
jgi:hypothetical protein